MNMCVLLLLYLQHKYNSSFLMSHSYRVIIIHNIPIKCSSISLLQSGNITYNKYNTFCREINQPPIPVCEDTLLLFVTNLAQQDLSYAMMQVYLSAVRYSLIKMGESTTLRTPRLNYALKGIWKTCVINHQP